MAARNSKPELPYFTVCRRRYLRMLTMQELVPVFAKRGRRAVTARQSKENDHGTDEHE